jgi:rSAM/selenodomain-associated transferase 1
MAERCGETLLIQFARSPAPGQVKTRMIPALTAQQASELHGELVLHSCRQLLAAELGPLELWVAGDPDHAVFTRCLRLGASVLRQQEGVDLGARMYHALRDGLERYDRVLLVGSDCPGIDAAYLREALQALDTAPVVFGPALDGGYVLVGAVAVDEGLFTGVAWGSAEVLARSLERAAGIGIQPALLEPLADIDRPQDLAIWRQYEC